MVALSDKMNGKWSCLFIVKEIVSMLNSEGKTVFSLFNELISTSESKFRYLRNMMCFHEIKNRYGILLSTFVLKTLKENKEHLFSICLVRILKSTLKCYENDAKDNEVFSLANALQ